MTSNERAAARWRRRRSANSLLTHDSYLKYDEVSWNFIAAACIEVVLLKFIGDALVESGNFDRNLFRGVDPQELGDFRSLILLSR